MNERTFPILWPAYRKDIQVFQRLGCPKSVPWSFVEPFEQRAQSNHEQTLNRLAKRGGLSPAEMLCLVEDVSLVRIFNDIREVIDIESEAILK